MNLTIITQWFPPEQAPFGRMMLEMATQLAQLGWKVTVITGFPNHPTGRLYPGFRKRWVALENTGGIRIVRVWLFTSHRRSLFSRVLGFLSFTLTSAWRLVRESKSDLIFAVLQPLSMGLVLTTVARIRSVPIVFNLQDLHPDTQIRLGLVRSRILIGALRAIERHAYRHSDGITAICRAFAAHAVANGARADRVHVVENWIDTERINPGFDGRQIREEAGIPSEGIVALWAGTLGHVSGADLLIESAERLSATHPHLYFLIVGDGPMRERLGAEAARRGLKRVRFLPFQPEDLIGQVQCAGDFALVTLAPEFGDSSVPSKVLAYLSAVRAIVASVPQKSASAEMLTESRAALVTTSGDIEAFTNAIACLSDDKSQRRALGERGRQFALKRFSRERVLLRYADILVALSRRP
jgi:colanic acid biosynthesis glycosyl transferase WcaI